MARRSCIPFCQASFSLILTAEARRGNARGILR